MPGGLKYLRSIGKVSDLGSNLPDATGDVLESNDDDNEEDTEKLPEETEHRGESEGEDEGYEETDDESERGSAERVNEEPPSQETDGGREQGGESSSRDDQSDLLLRRPLGYEVCRKVPPAPLRRRHRRRLPARNHR